MKTITCKRCGKVIEGYSDDQCQYMLDQHNLSHTKKDRENKKGGKKDGELKIREKER